jgi:hypothetical protein
MGTIRTCQAWCELERVSKRANALGEAGVQQDSRLNDSEKRLECVV